MCGEAAQVVRPGLLEAVYEAVLSKQRIRTGLAVEREKPIPIEFEGIEFYEGFRADMVTYSTSAMN